MSVLKMFRNTSSMQYVADTFLIQKDITRLVLKLSNKYTKIMEQYLITTSIGLVNDTLKANSIRVHDQQTFDERRNTLKDAKHKAVMLGAQLGVLLDLSMPNTDDSKLQGISAICQSIGETLDKEIGLIEGVMKSDKSRFLQSKKQQQQKDQPVQTDNVVDNTQPITGVEVQQTATNIQHSVEQLDQNKQSVQVEGTQTE